MTNSSTLDQQINEYETKLNELHKQREVERKGERLQAIAAAKDLIKTHDLMASELGLSGKAPAKRATSDKRNVVAPKYQDPESGKTWTGRGKSPAWLTAHLTAGRNKQEFLIQK